MLRSPALEVKQDLSQVPLIEKINLYHSAKTGKALIVSGGLCHGLALLWMMKMAERQEEWFYDLKKKIICFPEDRLKELIKTTASQKLFQSDFDKFINHIQWAQHSRAYTNVDQTDIEKIMDVPTKVYEKKNFSHCKQLQNHIKTILATSQFALIAGIGSHYGQTAEVGHTIAICYRNNQYYVYDSNYKEGRAKSFAALEALTTEVETRIKHAFRIVNCTFNYYEFFYSSHIKLQEQKIESPPIIPPEIKPNPVSALSTELPKLKQEPPKLTAINRPSIVQKNTMFACHTRRVNNNTRLVLGKDHLGKPFLFVT